MKELCRLCGAPLRPKRGDGKPICRDEHTCAARVAALRKRCCPHRRADHAGKNVGAKCTIPGCPCTGWVAVHDQHARGAGIKGARR